MKLLLNSLILCLCGPLLQAQYDSDNVNLLGHYDNDSLPIHTLGTFNDVWGYVENDREYAIFGSANFIHIFEVTDPSNLREVVSIETNNNSAWRDFKTYKQYAYAVADKGEEGLKVIDLSQLPDTAFVVLQETKYFDICHNIFIDVENDRLYTAGAVKGDEPLGGVHIFDLSQTPEEPVLMDHIPMSERYVHDIYVRDNIGYASSANSGYYIYDLSNPSDPKFKAQVGTNGYNHSSWVSEDGSFALFAEEVPIGLPLGIADLCDLENGNISVDNYFKFPIIEGLPDVHDLATPHNPFIKGDFAYVSYYHDGLHVYDLTNPSEVKRVGYFDAYFQNDNYLTPYKGTWGCYPFLPSGNILISDLDNGLFILDFLLDDNNEAPEGSLCPTTSTNQVIAETLLAVYPNPSLGLFMLELPSSDTEFEIRVLDLTGQIIYEEKTGKSYLVELNLKELNSGIYILELSNSTERYKSKLQIQHHY